MKREQIKTISYTALYIAMYIVLKYVGDLIPFLQMPNGGSIKLELVAIFLASYHLGWKGGAAVAIMSWLMSWLLGSSVWFVHPLQIILDYIGPVLVCGLASVLWPFRKPDNKILFAVSLVLGLAAFFGIMNSYSSGVAAAVSFPVAGGAFAFNNFYLKHDGKPGILLAMAGKYVLQVLSGVYYWFPEGSYAGSPASWAFSLQYNLWYNLVTMVFCALIVPELIRRLKLAKISFQKE